MQQNNIAETIIGALVIAVAVGFMAFIYTRTGSGSLSGYEINARLPTVDGLGSPASRSGRLRIWRWTPRPISSRCT